ncbi:MAG: carboxypeptidase M32 [Acetobacteraceae bacterium]
MSSAYERLAARFARIAVLDEAREMLGWDEATMMPPGGAAARADQLAALAGLAHEHVVSREVAGDLAAALSMAPDGDPWRAANLRLMRRAHSRAAALPAALVEASVRADSACEKLWREARSRADYRVVLPAFADVVRLARERAAALGAALGLEPYDALMDGFQAGIRAADLVPIFARYERFLKDALPRAEAIATQRPAPVQPAVPFPTALQEAFCRRVAERAGLSFTNARLDRSLHPFCGGIPSDVRITTRYDEADGLKAVFAVLHETGHALYERGLPVAYARQPVGGAAGMAAHESQSLIVEMQACHSEAFLGWLGPELARAFGPDAAFGPDNLTLLCRRVARGFIRVDADELTYPAHVILRFRLERGLIGGELKVADLPQAWNDAMEALLGIRPPDDAAGCLQDIHWYDGSFGYFPSYSLGAMAAAQLMAAAREATPGLDAALGEGDLSPLSGWLRTNVHSRGSLYEFSALLAVASGRPLDPAAFEAHLAARYLN